MAKVSDTPGGHGEVLDEYQRRLNKWGAIQAAARMPGCEVDPDAFVLLEVVEGQWYSEETGGDPPELEVSFRCKTHGKWHDMMFARDIGDVLRGLLAVKLED